MPISSVGEHLDAQNTRQFSSQPHRWYTYLQYVVFPKSLVPVHRQVQNLLRIPFRHFKHYHISHHTTIKHKNQTINSHITISIHLTQCHHQTANTHRSTRPQITQPPISRRPQNPQRSIPLSCHPRPPKSHDIPLFIQITA